MAILQFPGDRIVGTVDWGAWDGAIGPVLATGRVEVPAGSSVELEVAPYTGKTPGPGGVWQLEHGSDPVDLGFVRALPADAVEAVSIRSVDEATFTALAHLAPGLRRLTLAFSGLGDPVLSTIAQLTRLTDLQTFGNHFSDRAVQQLAALRDLERLYLEEDTLSAQAFDFAAGLPRLTRLGLQDVPVSAADIARLRRRLPHVRVG